MGIENIERWVEGGQSGGGSGRAVGGWGVDDCQGKFPGKTFGDVILHEVAVGAQGKQVLVGDVSQFLNEFLSVVLQEGIYVGGN